MSGLCDEPCGQHPTRPELTAICARPKGHDGEHSNVLNKPDEDAGEALLRAIFGKPEERP